MQSIQEFGFTNPVLIDENNVLIAGHGRTCAARTMGMTEVPAIRLTGLSETQRKALRIADNQLALNAGWDEELLKIELSELQDVDFDLDLLGFDMSELDDLLQGLGLEPESEQYREVEEDEPPTTNVMTRCKRGDIWQLGKHRLMCGDSTSVADVKRLMNGQLADMFLTDPPYNVDYEGGTGLKIQNDNMEDAQFRQFLIDAFGAADSVMKQGAVFYIWHADSEGYNFRGACHNVGWRVRQCLIWNKNSLVLGRQDYQWKHEPCLYGWKDGTAHLWNSDRKQTTVIDYDKPTRNADHPTMKPVGLFDYQIQNSTNVNDIVLDLFAGSGTTMAACEQNGRTAYMMELDEHYCDVIIQRWEDLTGNTAKRITPATCAS